MSTAPAHIVPVARPLFFILRIVQLVLAVVLLGLLAYLADVLFSGFTSVFSGALGVGLFSVCLTIILGVYYLVSTMAVHNIYNKWAVVGLEAAAVVFWLISFALIADCVANVVALETVDTYTYTPTTYCDDFGDCTTYKRLGKRVTVDTFNGVWYASLAFSVIEFLLFVATLVLFALALRKHHGPTGTTTTAEQGYTPKQMEAGQTPAQPAPAAEYPQQQVPQQIHEQPVQPVQHEPVQQEQVPMH